MILCLNATTGGVTEWDLDWLGVGVSDGVVYGLTADELVSLDGDDEDGFDAEIETGQLELGGLADVTVPRAYCEYDASEEATLTATTYYRGTATPVPYTLPVRSINGADSGAMRPVKMARGPRGPWVAMKLAGTDWSLRALQVIVNVLSRHS